MKKNTREEDRDSPLFDLPVENELLMLKLKAEFGAECTTGDQDIPPVVVNEFLKSVYEFEHKFREPRKLLKIYDKLGMPAFKKAEELPDKQLSRELKRLLRHMQQNALELDIAGEYPDRTIYTFITEEFFNHEMEDLCMPGYVHHFCYEEFHPNHELDITRMANEFLTQWFGKNMGSNSWQLADSFVLPDTREFSRDAVLAKIDRVFRSYTSFINCEYSIRKISFDWDEKRNTGRGWAMGSVKYDALTTNDNSVHFEGPFQFYLSNDNEWWNIFYFVFPGFSWNDVND